MSLKEELKNIEIKEIEKEDEDRLRRLEESICWIHRRIYMIADHINKEEKATPEEEEMWDCRYSEGYEDGANSVIIINKEEIEAIEKVLGIPVPSQNLTSLSHAIQNFMGNEPRKEAAAKERTGSEYAKGYEEGVKNLAEKMRDDIDKSLENKKELLAKLEEVLSLKVPQFQDLATIISQTQQAGKKGEL